jgi:Leucine-rich repeat (LRR) protein
MSEAPLAVGAPKLLELDKEDVKAVRTFLPGKVLGRTAALLALVVLVLGFAGTVDVALEKFLGFALEPTWLKNALLIGIPVLVVGAQIAAEWRANRQREAAAALAVKTEAVQDGYFRIGPYLDTPLDRAKFDRADRAHEKILDWLRGAEAVPLYLTGDSGSGKSSILNAYVLPELRDAGWTVVEARAWQDPEAALGEALRKLASLRKGRLPEPKSLREHLERGARQARGGLLIVLDQFEEFVILAATAQQRGFAVLLADLRARPIEGLKLLLVLRSDYTSAIDELELPPLRQGENWREVGRFTLAAGTRFLSRSGLALQPETLDRLATSAAELDDSPGMIRPITLNVVGHVLSEGRSTAPSLDAGSLVRHYIEQSVEQPAIRAIAPRVLSEMVTEQATKRPCSEQGLVEQTNLRLGEVRAVLNGLWAAALARPLDAKHGVWELSHDFVARAVARYLGRRRIDWPGIARAYAAPALFMLMAATAAGALVWNVGATDRSRAQLTDLGIVVSADGSEAVASVRFRAEDLGRVAFLLQRLTTLRALNLSNTAISDVGPLSGLTKLQTLTLRNSPVRDLRPLRGLIALRLLNLSGTDATDLAPLAGLTALQTLDASGRLSEDPRSLSLVRRALADIRPLKNLTALNTLNLYGTQVKDLEPLEGLTALTSLILRRTNVEDLKPLQGLTGLRGLDVSHPIFDEYEVSLNLDPLKELTGLTSLNLAGRNVEDLSPLMGLTALESLDVSEDDFYAGKPLALEPIKDLTKLEQLQLAYRDIRDFGPLKTLTSLQRLDLSTNLKHRLAPLPPDDIAPLGDLKGLRMLSLAGLRVATLGSLEGLIALRSLAVSVAGIDDLGPLRALTELRYLSLQGAQTKDLTPLRELPNLRHLEGVAGAEVRKFNAYREQKGLPLLDLSN